MKILIIGGTGNISESVAKTAVEMGYEVFLLNREQTPNSVVGAHVIRGDINEPETMDEVLRKMEFDVVVDFIAFTPDDVRRDIKAFTGSIQQYIFISSASVYEKDHVRLPIRESNPLSNAKWAYAANKIACEKLLLDEWEKRQFPVTIVRPAHTYDKMIPLSIGKGFDILARIQRNDPIIIPDSGNSLWTLTHSLDFARGFVGLIGNPAAIGEAFHITSDELLTWNQIFRTVALAVGITDLNCVHIPGEIIGMLEPDWGPTIVCDKACSVIFDNSKIKSFVPGFTCKIPFHVGIRNTLERLRRGDFAIPVLPDAENRYDKLIMRWNEMKNYFSDIAS